MYAIRSYYERYVEGLRDPASTDPASVLAAEHLDDDLKRGLVGDPATADDPGLEADPAGEGRDLGAAAVDGSSRGTTPSARA